MSNFHPALQGPVMEWGAQHLHPSAQPFPWNSQWLRGQLRTRQVCAGDVPGLMGDGTGLPDGQAKVRQGDGHAEGQGLGGSHGTPVSLQMGALQGHLPTLCWPCPGRQQGFGSGEKGRPRLGNALRVRAPPLVSHSPWALRVPAPCALLLPPASQAFPGEISLPCLLCPTHLGFLLKYSSHLASFTGLLRVTAGKGHFNHGC